MGMATLPEDLIGIVTEEDFSTLRQAFEAFDCNGNWSLEFGEVSSVLKVLGLGHISDDEVRLWFRKLDRDGNGQLEFSEFVHIYAEIRLNSACTSQGAVHILTKRPHDRSPDDLHRLANHLTSVWPWATQFNRPMLLEICRHMEVAHFKPGQWLWQQEAHVPHMVGILEGTVSLWQHPALLRAMSTMQRSTTSKSLAQFSSLGVDAQLPSSPAAQPSEAHLDLDSPPASPGALVGAGARSGRHHRQGTASNPISPKPSQGVSLNSPKAPDRKSIRFQMPAADAVKATEHEANSKSRRGSEAGHRRFSEAGSRRLSEAGSMHNRKMLQHTSFKHADTNDSLAAHKRSASQHASFKERVQPDSELGRRSQRRRSTSHHTSFKVREHDEPDNSQHSTPLLGRASARVGFGHLSISVTIQDDSDDSDNGIASKPALSPWEKAAIARQRWAKLGLAIKFYRRAALARLTLDTIQGSVQSVAAKVPRASKVLISSLIQEGVLSGVEPMDRIPASVLQALHEVASQHQSDWQQGRDGSLLRNPKSISMSHRQRQLLKASSTASGWDNHPSSPTAEDHQLGTNEQGDRLLSAASSKRSRVMSLIQSLRRAVSVSQLHDSPVSVGFCQAGQWLNESVLLPLFGATTDGPSAARVGALAASHVTCVLITKEALKQAMLVVSGGPGFSTKTQVKNNPVESMIYKPDFLMHLAGKSQLNVCEEAMLSHYLGMVGALAQLPFDLRARLARAVLPQAYARGELVIRQGDVPHAMYVIISGDVGVFKDSTGLLVTRSRNLATTERIHNSGQAGQPDAKASMVAASAVASKAASTAVTVNGIAAKDDGCSCDDDDEEPVASTVQPQQPDSNLPATLGVVTLSSHQPSASTPSLAADDDAPVARPAEGVRFMPSVPSLRVRSITTAGASIRHRLASSDGPTAPVLTRSDSNAAKLAADFISRAKSAPGMRRPDLVEEEDEQEEDAPVADGMPALRSVRTFVPELSASAKERHALMGSGLSGQAAAMRAKHAALRGKLGGSSNHRVLLTEQHAESANKVAALLLGEKLGTSLRGNLDASASHTSVHQMEELEKMLGELHQQMGPFRTVGEHELLASIPSGGAEAAAQEPGYLKRREHSVLAMQACCTLQIEISAYVTCVSEWRKRELAVRLAFLSNIPCCTKLKKQALIAVDSSLQWLDVPRGAVLQTAGSACQGLILVQSGTLGLYHPPSRTSTQAVLQQHAAALERQAMDDSQWIDDQPSSSQTPPVTASKPINATNAPPARQLLAQSSSKPGASMSRSLTQQVSQAMKTPATLQQSPTLRSSRLGSGAAALSPRTLARQMSISPAAPGGEAGSKDVFGSAPASTTGGFSARQAMRCVGLLGPGDFCGEDGLVGGVHQVSIVAETACKVAVLKTSDMLLLEEAGLTSLIKHSRYRGEQRSKQAMSGPDLWAPGAAPTDVKHQPKGGAVGLGSPSASAEKSATTGQAKAPRPDQTSQAALSQSIEESWQPQGWFVPGTGVALALTALAPTVPKPPEKRSKQGTGSHSAMGGPSPEAVQAYERWLGATVRHAQHASTLLPAPSATSDDNAKANSQHSTASPRRLVSAAPPTPGSSHAQGQMTGRAGEQADAGQVNAASAYTEQDASTRPPSVPERAYALLQAARTPLVLGLHKAPAHLDLDQLRHLSKPAGLADILQQLAAPPQDNKVVAAQAVSSAQEDPGAVLGLSTAVSLSVPTDDGRPDDVPVPSRTLSVRQRTQQENALFASPMLKKPAHLLNSTSCLAHMTEKLIPGILSSTSVGLDAVELEDEQMTSDVWGGRSEVNKLRGAQPAFLVGKQQASLFRSALNDLLKSSPSRKVEAQRSAAHLVTEKARPATASAAWIHTHSSRLSLLYSRAGQAPALLGSLNSGLHFSTAAVTSSRWAPGRATPQAMMVTRTTLLGNANAIAAQQLGLSW